MYGLDSSVTTRRARVLITNVSDPGHPRARHPLQVLCPVHHSHGRVLRDRKLGRLAVLPKLLNVSAINVLSLRS